MSRYQQKDRFFKQAKDDAFVARSIYKLEELDRRYKLFKKGQTLIDLGCSPGSWLQYLSVKLGKKGRLLGYDIVPCDVAFGPTVLTRVADVQTLSPETIWADFETLKPSDASGQAPRVSVDALVSDMAPKLSGIRDADQARSVLLVRYALNLAEATVKPGGFFVAKLFQGRDTDAFVGEIKTVFKEVKLLKPEATREGSREVFVLARERRS